MTEPATLGTHAKWLKDANTKMISLYNEESVTTHTALKECSTNTNYQVPVGKKFVLLNLVARGIKGHQSIRVFSHSSPSTSGGTQVFTANNGGGLLLTGYNESQIYQLEFNLYIDGFGAGQYVNTQHTATGLLGFAVTGIETDV